MDGFYTFNGVGGDSDAEEEFSDEPPAPLTPPFIASIGESFNTGVDKTGVLGRYFPAFHFDNSALPGQGGSLPSFGASEYTGPTAGNAGGDEKTEVFLGDFLRSVRVPKASVLPTRDTLGTSLRGFLDEVAQTIPEFDGAEKKTPRDLFYENTSDIVSVDDEQTTSDVEPSGNSGRSEVEVCLRKSNSISVTWQGVSLYAPWVKERPQFKWHDMKEPFDPPVDLTVGDDVFSDYLRAFRSNRIVSIMKDLYPHPNLVTLVLETEADVWMACGGSLNRLPENTWITKRAGAAKNFRAVVDTDRAETRTTNDLFREFITTHQSDVTQQVNGLYVGDKTTLESQLFNQLHEEINVKAISKAFHTWCGTKRVKSRLSLTDVLRKGGLNDKLVEESADKLVLFGIRDGYVRGDGSNAMEQLLFRNSYPSATGKRLKIIQVVKKTAYGANTGPDASGEEVMESVGNDECQSVDNQDEGQSVNIQDEGQSVDNQDECQSVNIQDVVNAFRRGKETVLKDATRDLDSGAYGERALVVVDPDYRRHFITLCRANYQLKRMNVNSSVLTDRRRRVIEQERVKRECLHFFQTQNGSSTYIAAQFCTQR